MAEIGYAGSTASAHPNRSEILVTLAMIEAGVDLLFRSGALNEPILAEEGLCCETPIWSWVSCVPHVIAKIYDACVKISKPAERLFKVARRHRLVSER